MDETTGPTKGFSNLKNFNAYLKHYNTTSIIITSTTKHRNYFNTTSLSSSLPKELARFQYPKMNISMSSEKNI